MRRLVLSAFVFTVFTFLGCSDKSVTPDPGNRSPRLASIGARTTVEGDSLAFDVTATDPDKDSLLLSADNIPPNACFTDRCDCTGCFTFRPNYSQAGSFLVMFVASDGLLADTEVVRITVSEAGNQAPVLDPVSSRFVEEGENLNFEVTASDPDGTIPSLSAQNLPERSSFTDNKDGTGAFDFTPDFKQAGAFSVIFVATDGSLADTEIVEITVGESGNKAPILDSIGPRTVDEGGSLSFGVSASDPDGTVPALSAVNLPDNSSFSDNADGTGVFDFMPDFKQSGVYEVTFIATDGALADSEIVEITVGDPGNQAPVIDPIGAREVDEGDNLNFAVSVSDPDGDVLVLLAENLPANSSFTDNSDGTGVFDFTSSYTQEGVYFVLFMASDGSLADTEVVKITVNDAGNQAPVLDSIGPMAVSEGENLNFEVSASDADGTIPSLEAENLPANSSFDDNGDGTGEFDFTPDHAQAGTYNVTFIASDGSLADSEVVEIVVSDVGNQAPILYPIGPRSVAEGDSLSFDITASDPDGTVPSLVAENLPANASFADNADGTGTFDFTPGQTQAGSYNVMFIASDSVAADTEMIYICVAKVNLPPVFEYIGGKAVKESSRLNFTVTATDEDEDLLTLLAEGIPENATFTNNYDGTGTFDFRPNFYQAGVCTVAFIASDGVLADTDRISITVNEGFNLIPGAVGNYWVYERINAHSWEDPPGVYHTEADTTVDSVAIVDGEVVDGDTWWLLSGDMLGIGDRFMVRNDSVFGEAGLELIPCVADCDSFCSATGWGYGAGLELELCFYPWPADTVTVPAGQFIDCLEYGNGPWPLNGLSATECFDIAPGVGLVNDLCLTEWPAPEEGTYGFLYRLLRYRIVEP